MGVSLTVSEFRDSLLSTGIITSLGIDGLYARSGDFESVAEGLQRIVRSCLSDPSVPSLRFPPVMPLSSLEGSGYPRSFPDMLAVLRTFDGSDRDHAELLRALDDGSDWTNSLNGRGLALCSAACHPLYPLCAGQLPDGGATYELVGHCFRHEPSIDPARMQTFRQHEVVRLGSPDEARDHRDEWIAHAERILGELGLTTEVEVANDPFFGRAGRILANSQRQAALKLEVLCDIGEPGHRVAVASGNCHGDHFGEAWQIRTSDGEHAHTACIGFGLERITLALFWKHGLDVEGWPAPVRQRLFDQ